MNIEEFRAYCISKKHVSECFPFDEKTLVFKVAGKMFALSGLDSYPTKINLKCDPERAIDLREEFSDIIAGFHMNKKHWNTVYVDNTLPIQLIKDLIDHSYELVVQSLTKKVQQELKNL